VHDNVLLGGPVWLFAQLLILGTVVLSVFVFVDSMMPRRRAKVGQRLPEPLWVYTVTMGAYLAVLIAVQIIPGLQVASAIAAIASPFALAFGVIYLLRAVFPKHASGESTVTNVENGSGADTTGDPSQ